MTTPNSNAQRRSKKAKRVKPSKPSPDFPLTAHPSGQWCKTIKYKLYYFGVWDDPDAALAKYENDAPFIRQGLDPNDPVIQIDFDNLTVDGLVQLFLNEKHEKVSAGENAPETLLGYRDNAAHIFKTFKREKLVEELRPNDFKRLRAALGEGVKFSSLSTRVTHIRAIFNWGSKNYYIKSPMAKLWGTQFQKPSVKIRNLEKSKAPSRVIPSEVFFQLIEYANDNLKALLYLVINSGIGNNDLANLKSSDIDFQNHSVELPRQKTGEPRKAFLWPETINAIKEAISNQSEPSNPEDKDLVFINGAGGNYRTKVTGKGKTTPITREFTRLRKRAGLDSHLGLSFYAFRHTFQTIADNATLDFVGVRSVMGHTDGTISGNYRHGVSDERLKHIADAVRTWLFETKSN